jgi:hypothetical protein
MQNRVLTYVAIQVIHERIKQHKQHPILHGFQLATGDRWQFVFGDLPLLAPRARLSPAAFTQKDDEHQR